MGRLEGTFVRLPKMLQQLKTLLQPRFSFFTFSPFSSFILNSGSVSLFFLSSFFIKFGNHTLSVWEENALQAPFKLLQRNIGTKRTIYHVYSGNLARICSRESKKVIVYEAGFMKVLKRLGHSGLGF